MRGIVALTDALMHPPFDAGTESFQPSNLEVTTIDVGNRATNVVPGKATASFNIRVNDKASFDNKTDRSRTNKSGMNWSTSADFFGYKPPETTGELGSGSDTSTQGKGSTERSEKLTLLVAAVVTGILENGNLLISGSQEVRVNHEIRILNVAGIVRPQDVDADNTISYERIAEARISYGGRGRLTEVQQPPVGQQVVDLFSPI